jgi:hypothetical protein
MLHHDDRLRRVMSLRVGKSVHLPSVDRSDCPGRLAGFDDAVTIKRVR